MNDVLNAVLDTLIPPSADGRMPGAGALDLADDVRALAGGDANAFLAGLDEAAAAGITELAPSERVAALRDIEAAQPQFVAGLYFHACTVYYRHPQVLVALGLEPRPPHPEGYALEPGNLSALERVRARGKLYRDA